MSKRALIFGASGLVGSELLKQQLLDDRYEHVTAVVRRPLSVSHPKLEQRTLDFEKLHESEGIFQVDEIFCCLGTTIKTAGSQAAFRKVDFDYPLRIGVEGKQAGVKQMIAISSLGANPASKVFYSRTKGEMERALTALSLPSLTIVRPSLLLGERAEFRFGERAAAAVTGAMPFLFAGPLKRYKPIHARTVARAMLASAFETKPGVRIIESRELAELGI